ncbi:ATP-binding cassette domain-containing protein [Agrobacterium sp. NPDC090273]|uniref:ATP-binding cassette domain-containing protein n=1 Tax=Agrobacterium sp. NPDC090273 TaxID=3363919 RepID=UPI00383B7455
MSATAILTASNLTMRFGGVVANDNVDFVLGDRELRCIIGPNGAGKSTFFKMLTGQLTPTQGSIELKGRSVAGHSSHEIARLGVGIKNQVPSVFEGLTVRENVWLAARRRFSGRQLQEKVEEQLELIRLGAYSSRVVGTLSHGQRQWVEIGTVLATNPDLVLLDEPAAGMTDEETIRTAEIILDMNRTRAVVVVEHDMQFIKMIAKKVTVFHQGKVLVEDEFAKVVADQRVRDVYLGRTVV